MTQNVNVFYLMKSYVREIIDVMDFCCVHRGFGRLWVNLSHLYRCCSIVGISDKFVRHDVKQKPGKICDLLRSTWQRTAEKEWTILANQF